MLRSKLPNVGTTIFTEMSLLAQQHGAVNLGQGFPDYDPPAVLQEALVRAMAEGRHQYAPMPGVPELREQVALLAHRMHGRKVDAGSEVTITSGGTEALFAAIAAAVSLGDEVLLLDPCYDSYDPAVRLQGGLPVHVPLADDFSVDWDRVEASLSPRTRLIVLNTPHNPTGAVLGTEDLEALAALIRDRDVLVLSDEVYAHLTFDGEPHHGLLGHPELADRAFVVGSFGKTWHCTGWKVGSCIAPAALTAEFRKVHQFLTFATFTPAQVALARVMAEHPEHAAGLPGFYQAKRDAFRESLRDSRWNLLPVYGGFFQVADYGEIQDVEDRAFCQWLTETVGVAAIPLSAFYERPPEGQRRVRFCFAKREATLSAAAARLKEL